MKLFTPRKVATTFGMLYFAFLFQFFSHQSFAQPGRVDLSFGEKLAVGAGVQTIELQPDGKILIAGKFQTTGAFQRFDIIRLNPDNSLDTSFDTGSGVDGAIRNVKVQIDGKVLIGGDFQHVNGVLRPVVARLNANGSLDDSFASNFQIYPFLDLDVQSNGKVLVAGAENTPGLVYNVWRLNADGSVDRKLFPTTSNRLFYPRIDVMDDDKILLAGLFDCTVPCAPNSTYFNLARLNADGTHDTSFRPAISMRSIDLFYAGEAAETAGGKILVWGLFDSVDGMTRKNLAMLNPDGSLDASFSPATGTTEQIVKALRQANGKVLFVNRKYDPSSGYHPPLFLDKVVRLNADGTVDNRFNPGRGTSRLRSNSVMEIRGGNKLLVGGEFFRYNGMPHAGLVQLGL